MLNEMAPRPQGINTKYFNNQPTSGTAVHNRTINKPTTMRPINGHSSFVRPSTHCPTSPPTITCATYSAAYQTNSAETPTNNPTTVMQAMMAAIGIPKATSTP